MICQMQQNIFPKVGTREVRTLSTGHHIGKVAHELQTMDGTNISYHHVLNFKQYYPRDANEAAEKADQLSLKQSGGSELSSMCQRTPQNKQTVGS